MAVEWLTVAEAAAALPEPVSVRTMQRWVVEGMVPARQRGGQWRIRRQDLLAAPRPARVGRRALRLRQRARA